jgi:hypothetical protein
LISLNLDSLNTMGRSATLSGLHFNGKQRLAISN